MQSRSNSPASESLRDIAVRPAQSGHVPGQAPVFQRMRQPTIRNTCPQGDQELFVLCFHPEVGQVSSLPVQGASDSVRGRSPPRNLQTWRTTSQLSPKFEILPGLNGRRY